MSINITAPKELLESTLESLPYPAWIVGPNRQIASNNKAQMLGLNLKTISKKREGFTLTVDNQSYRMVKRKLDKNHTLIEFKLYDLEARKLRAFAAKLDRAINKIDYDLDSEKLRDYTAKLDSMLA